MYTIVFLRNFKIIYYYINVHRNSSYLKAYMLKVFIILQLIFVSKPVIYRQIKYTMRASRFFNNYLKVSFQSIIEDITENTVQ